MVHIRRDIHLSIPWLVGFMIIAVTVGGMPIPGYWLAERLSSSVWAEPKAQYQILWDEANRLEKAGDFAGAIRVLHQVLDLQKQSYFYTAINLGKIGVAYYGWGKYDEALKYCDQAANLFKGRGQSEVRGIVDLTPNYRYCLLCKARAYEKKGELEKAVAEFEAMAKTGQDQSAEINRLKRAQIDRRERKLKTQQARQKANEAEQQGEYGEAFRHYMAALEMADTLHLPMVIKILELYPRLDPAPPIPEEARKHAAFASFAVKEAKDNKGYEKAIVEYFAAIRLAPWWADLHLNTALILEQVGDYQAAYEFLKIYPLAAPKAADMERIKTKLYELEFKAEQGKK